MVAQTGGWPFYLQVLAHAYVEEARVGSVRRPLPLKYLQDLYKRALLDEYEFVFRQRCLNLPNLRAILLRAIDGLLPNAATVSTTGYRTP